VTRVVVGPFNRVEGDLEVALEVEGGAVRSAQVSSPLYRGFETILEGKPALDALVIVPRVCGICSVAQSAAAARALADAARLAPAPNGVRAGNVVQAAENLADHLTHFYLFFMPDFARPAYAARPWYAAVLKRFQAMRGSAAAEVLAARGRLLEVMGLLAGKWPHTLALQPGGTSRPVDRAERSQLTLVLRTFRRFLERTLFGDALESVAALDSGRALSAWAARPGPAAADAGLFLRAAQDLALERLGRGGDAFLSYGAYPAPEGGFLFGGGVFDRQDGQAGDVRPLDTGAIREDVRHAWLAGAAPRHPRDGETVPAPDKEGAYTRCKAPRLAGRAMEVGALARQLVAGHPLARDLAASGGGNVLSRVVARLLELALVVPAMERWADELEAGAPFCARWEAPGDAAGVGLTEAARGALGHWVTLRGGRIERYQIVSPTTWNFSPRDDAGAPGPLERALVGAPAGEGEAGVAVQHVVRSFDPCMVCTVH
jgi:hydrogenase large subunit